MKKTSNEIRKESIKNKDKPNYRILWIAAFFVILFFCMAYYIADYSISNRKELISNSYNTRQKILASHNIRGNIYSRDNDILVESTINEDGVEIRDYKYGRVFAHAIGYAVNGKMGIESDANYYLLNSNAPLSEKAGADSKGEKYQGDSVYSTLDLKLQQVAYDSLGAYNGAVIVTEPSTGKILAMVSKPDFDPAEIGPKWDEFIKDEKKGVLLNRATQGLYPPGSTFKIVTALEYVRENPENFADYKYQCGGSFKHGDDIIRCYHGSVHNDVNFTKSFAKSCNSSFANIGMMLDRDKFGILLEDLLFNSDLPTDLVTSKCKLEVSSDTDDSDMIQIAIGQGKVNVTPLWLNIVTCAIANNGVLYKPYIIESVKNSKGKVIEQFKPIEYGSLIDKSEADLLQRLMEEVVISGTATKLKDGPYYAGGKTGSAEFGEIKGESHAWFTGFAGMVNEDENENSIDEIPDICVTIIVEGAGTGADYAVPIAKRIFDAYYDIAI